MAEVRTISTRLEIDGEKEYRKSLSEIYSNLKLIGAELKLNTAEFDANADSVKGNQERADILTKKIEQEKVLIESLSQAVADSTKAYGDNSKQTDAYRLKLMAAQTEVAKLGKELESIQGESKTFGDRLKDVTKQLGTNLAEGAKKAGKAIQEAIGKVGKTALNGLKSATTAAFNTMKKAAEASAAALAALGAGATAAAKKVYDLTREAGQYADTMLTMAQTTGVSAESLQKWEYASQFIDTSVATITDSMTKITQSMTNGSEATAQAFAALGVNVRTSTGALRDDETVFWEVIDALGNVTNETQRDSLAMVLLGETAKNLNPLIEAGSTAFRQLGDEAQAAGLIMSGETIAAFGAFDDSMNVLKTSTTAAGRAIAAEFLPQTQLLVTSATDVVTAFIGMVSGAENGSTQFSAAIDSMVGNAINMFQTLLPAVINLAGPLMQSLASGLLQAMPTLTAAFPQIVDGIVSGLSAMLPQIVSVGVQIISSVVDGISSAIPAIASELPSIISTIVSGLTDLLPKVIAMGTELLKGLLGGIRDGIPELTKALPEIITSITDGLTRDLPDIINMGIDILLSLTDGIINAIPSLVANLPKIIETIVSTLLSRLPDILKVGVNLVKGLWQGIQSMIGWLWDKLTGWVGGIMDKIKSLFGIHSPSRVFRKEIGQNIGKGVALGIADEEDDVANAFHRLMPDMSPVRASIQEAGYNVDRGTPKRTVDHTETVDGQQAAQMGNQTIIMQVDGREFARVTTPYIDRQQAVNWQRNVSVGIA